MNLALCDIIPEFYQHREFVLPQGNESGKKIRVAREFRNFQFTQIAQDVSLARQPSQIFTPGNHFRKTAGNRPPVGAVINDDGNDGRQGAELSRGCSGMAFPNPHHVGRELQGKTGVRGRFVFREYVDVRVCARCKRRL